MPELDWANLGQWVLRERQNQRISQSEVQARGGPSATLVRQIEKATVTSISARTKTGLEEAFGWRRGVVDALLRGAERPSYVSPRGDERGDAPSSVGGSDHDEDVFEIKMRRPEGVSVEEWKRMKADWEAELQFKLNRAAHER
ncbi:hypothetical protein [uncultured Aeromicrobium sp.]|uniref:hypothetical protein n=1 Tax=uncultured Aeromicrobium sp. TaxID=337820 RepID=UPI0025E9B61E|nr:hypothetical protein [uncultured Aeromicrobium sp.]